MIRQDNISRGMFVVAVLISIYLATYQTTALILFPTVLLLSGMVMEYQLERQGKGFRKGDEPDTTTERKDLTTTLYWAIGGFAGILVCGFSINFVNNLNSLVTATMAITNYDLVLFSSLMAVSEEMFFRGFILEVCFSVFKIQPIAVFASAIAFALYHLARYGTQFDTLLYVFAGGLILSFITWKTQRLGSAILAHTANNVFATIGAIVA